MDKDKIKEMLEPKFSFLENFRKVAPGTYKHCQSVAGLCESVALELDLDTTEMNLAGFYHDIGKMVNPDYFSENQNGKNIHDTLEPDISYQFITRHVGDTLLFLLQIPNFPLKIMKVISQHHGNTVLRYFFNKASSDVDDHYRYRCQAPKTVEAAVLMICDSVEATSKALFSNGSLQTPEERKKVVNSTLDRLAKDEQLDNLTYGQGRIIKNVLYKELENTYHKREVYPDDETSE